MNKAEKITIKVLKVVERIARNEVEKTVLGRTAECSAIYQCIRSIAVPDGRISVSGHPRDRRMYSPLG